MSVDSAVPADFLPLLFHKAIDAGADVVIRHGPHELNGIEIYKGKPIFYSLGSLFFGSRYWINDPWQYRLPEVYGPYRWVRYYDDALLVDIYSGEVVDVIYDFFW